MRRFRRLTRHFAAQILDNDLISRGDDLHVPIAGILSALMVTSAGAALMFLGKYNSVVPVMHGGFRPAHLQTLADKLAMALDDKTLILAGVMIAMALVTVVFWDSLGLDERDVVIFGPLPVRPATVLAAKACAAALLASVVALALNALPGLLFPVVVLAKAPVTLGDVVQGMLALTVTGLAACAFVFLTLSSLRALLGVLLPDAIARRALPILQFASILALVSLLLAMPVLAGHTRAAIEAGRSWVFFSPAVWFLGLEEWLIGRSETVFVDLARMAIAALGISLAAAIAGHLLALGLRSHLVAAPAASAPSLINRMAGALLRHIAAIVANDGRARATFLFTAYALTRNPRHRLYLAGSLGLGIAVASATIAAAYGGLRFGRHALDVTSMGLAGQLNLIFFLVVGLRLAVTVPADLDAGWIFRFHATAARDRYVAGTRGAIFVLAVLPLLLVLAPLHAWAWGWYFAIVHLAFGIVAALGLLEVVFTDYPKLPLVAAFASNRTLLTPRFGLYFLNYLLFVYVTPSIEQVLVERTGMFYAWLALFVVVVLRSVRSQSTRGRGDRMPVFEEHSISDLQQLELGYIAAGPFTPAHRDELGAHPGFTTERRSWSAPSVLNSVLASRWSADQMRREVTLAVRRLRAQPGFTLFSVLSLALGIGATTALYSVIYTTILKPLDVPDLDRLVNVYHADPGQGPRRHYYSMSYPDFEDLRSTQTVFSDVAAHAPFAEVVVANGSGEMTMGEIVSGNYFSTLGIRPALGRTLQTTDERAGAIPVAVIGERLWRRRFDGGPTVLGRSVLIAGHPFLIVGVSPADFRGVEVPNITPTELWVPLNAAGFVGNPSVASDREMRWLVAKGRLAPGRTVAHARSEVAVIGRRLDREFPLGRDLPPQFRSPPDVARRWTALPTADRLVVEDADPTLRRLARIVMIAVGLVLLVACSNLANLALARGSTRRRELAVRLALGASRARVVREELVESAIVATLGGLAAVVLAHVLIVHVLSTTLPTGFWVAIEVTPTFDGGVALVAVVSTLVALFVAGLLPALQTSGGDTRPALGGEASGTTSPRWQGRRLLIASQVAVSVALVAVATLSVRQISEAARHDSGLDLDRLALVRFDFSNQRWNDARARRALERIAGEVEQHAAIDRVTVASGLPVGSGGQSGARLATPENPFSPPTYYGQSLRILSADPAIFATYGLRITAGRAFDDRDGAAATPVIVLTETAARNLFGTEQVVGRHVLRSQQPDRSGVETLTIVGVAADTDSGSLGRRTEGVGYVPYAQNNARSMALVARTSGDSAAALAVLTSVARRLEPELAIVQSGTGARLGGVDRPALEIIAGVAGLLGVLALTLAMAGLYGVVSYVVTRRTHEIGVRLALGATASRMVRLVVVDGMRPVIVGLVMGFVLADLVQMSIRPAMVDALPAIDATTLAVVPLPFLGAALLACYVPSRRAARVAPSKALRQW